jgi:hypothetical protein
MSYYMSVVICSRPQTRVTHHTYISEHTTDVWRGWREDVAANDGTKHKANKSTPSLPTSATDVDLTR